MKLDNAFLVLISVVLCAAVLGSFLIWWYRAEDRPQEVSIEFAMFSWSLVSSVVFLLIRKATQDRKQ